MKDELTPVHIPKLPDPRGLTSAQVDAMLTEREEYVQWASEENERRLDAAMFRIKLCTQMKSFAATARGRVHDLSSHYSWCPAPLWYDLWDRMDREGAFIDTDKAYDDLQFWREHHRVGYSV